MIIASPLYSHAALMKRQQSANPADLQPARHMCKGDGGSTVHVQGGDAWERVAGFYSSMYGVGSMQESAERITSVLKATAGQAPVIVVAHNGPTGLGDKPHDICGRDWRTAGGGAVAAVSHCCDV